MHMADALLSPLIAGTFWIVSGALIGYSAKKITQENDSSKTPLMGVMGAFIFAAQMINFTIPGTGSSGHIGGGLLLAALLGPYRAFITLASVLVIQCLFFADGGILALGCNIFNLAFFPAFIIYPIIFKKITLKRKSPVMLAGASLIAAEVGLLLGAMSVVIQTVASGVTELPLQTFAIFMLPIHSAIGIVEGLVTFGVLTFITKVEPALLSGKCGERSEAGSSVGSRGDGPEVKGGRRRLVVLSFVIGTLMIGGLFSWYASSKPDGLEWSMTNASGMKEFARITDKDHSLAESVQQKVAFFPDYSFRPHSENTETTAVPAKVSHKGTSASGIIGSLLVLILAVTIGFFVRGKTVKSQAGT
jgi:cobalt/nickel transport system permease protein